VQRRGGRWWRGGGKLTVQIKACSLSPLHSRPEAAAMRLGVLVLLGHIKVSGVYGQADEIGEVKNEIIINK
jgi:hypothetical protein